MGWSLSFGVGPVRYSTRLRGRSSDGDDQATLALVVVAAIALMIAAVTMAPEWSYEATTGRWGVTVFFVGVLGITALLLGPFVPGWWGAAPLLSWLLYGLHRSGWWALCSDQLSSINRSLIGKPWDSVDNGATNLLGAIVWAVAALLAIVPVGVAVLAAAHLNNWLTQAIGNAVRRLARVLPPAASRQPRNGAVVLATGAVVVCVLAVTAIRWPDSWPTSEAPEVSAKKGPVYRVSSYEGHDVATVEKRVERSSSSAVGAWNFRLRNADKHHPAVGWTITSNMIICTQSPPAGSFMRLPTKITQKKLFTLTVVERGRGCPS